MPSRLQNGISRRTASTYDRREPAHSLMKVDKSEARRGAE